MSAKGRRILFVDDEPQIVSVVTRGLSARGYEVVTSLDADTASQILRTDSAFDVIVTDVTLSGTSGSKMVEQLRLERNEIPVIYTSGLSGSALREHGIDDRDPLFLQKPWMLKELIALIETVIG